MSDRELSEWWRNPDGWLFALCHLTALGGSSDTWVVAALKPKNLDPALVETDWQLHHFRKYRNLDDAKTSLQRLLDQRGGGIRVESPAGVLIGATRHTWIRRLLGRLLGRRWPAWSLS